MKRNLFVPMALAIAALAVLWVLIMGSIVEAQEGCKVLEISSPVEGELIVQSLESSGSGACIEILPHFPGILKVRRGWVFTTPLTFNEAEIATSRVEGELAPQIDPFTSTLFAGESGVFRASPTEGGSSELGLVIDFIEEEPQCTDMVITEPITGTLVTNSLTDTVRGACIRLASELAGEVQVTAGWAYTSPVTANGASVTTVEVEGELAPQIEGFTQTLKAGEAITIAASPLQTKASELGIWVNFLEEEKFTIFLPMIRKDPVPIIEERTFSGELETFSTSWTDVPDGQETCLRILFTNSADAELVRGWTTDPFLEATLNGNTLQLETYGTTRELFPQIAEKALPNPQVLEICLDKYADREIGIVLSQ